MRLAVSPLALAAVLAAAAPARADVVVCNDLQAALHVAIAYQDAGSVTSHGWWRVEGRQCRELPFSPLDFFYAAESEQYWEGGKIVQHTWGRGRRLFVGSGKWHQFKLARAEQARQGAREIGFTSFAVGEAHRAKPHVVTIRFRPGTTTVETRLK